MTIERLDHRLNLQGHEIDLLRQRQVEHLKLSEEVRVLAQTTADNTREVVELIKAFHGAFVVLEFIGKAARPVAWVLGFATGCVLLWNQLIHGNKP